MEDKDIIELYKERKERAIFETKAKYGRYCRYIAAQILSNDDDVDEVENDIYLKVWITIPPASPKSLKSYVGLISRTLSLNVYEKKHAIKRCGEVMMVLDELTQCIPDGNSGSDIGDSVALRQSLNNFLHSLPQRTRKIFLRRYWYSSTVAEIAEEYRMSENAVTVLLHRTRKKLKKFLDKEGFIV